MNLSDVEPPPSKNSVNKCRILQIRGEKVKRRYNEKGSITIEAALALPLFMMAFLAILLLSKTVRAEANVQYAIDQTAKEISQYYYVINKLGLTAENEPDAEQLTKMDEFLESLNGFSSSVKSSAENAADYSINTENIDIKTLSNDIKTICDGLTSDYNSIKSSAEKVGEKFNAIAEDPMAIIQCMVTMLKSQVTNEVLSRFVAQPLCKAIMPKYITNQGDVNDTLEDMGVVDGFDGIDFGLSTFMKDGKSINVVVLYKIKVVGFGFIDYELNIKQTASTAAWGRLNTIAIYLNDKLLKEYSAEEIQENFKENKSYDFTINAGTYDKNDVKIILTDAAGNEETAEYTDVIVTTSRWVLFYTNTPLLIGSIVFLILLIAAVIFIIVRKSGKNKSA